MAFTITGNVTDLDMDVPRHVGLAVTSVTALLDVGSVRLSGAKGRFDTNGDIVKDVPFGHASEPWVIAVREGASLRLSTTHFVGHFKPIPFVAPVDGTVLRLADLVAANIPVPATPTGSYVRGASAYEIAVANGFSGTQEQWIATLEGDQGIPGLSAYEVAVSNGFVGTEPEWLSSLSGSDANVAASIAAHVQNEEPHDAYDRDMLNLTVIFDNVLA